MSDAKTKPTRASVKKFIAAVENNTRRSDAETLVAVMSDITGEKPVMWGPSIVGFGKYRYTYASGQQGDWPLIGFSPRKTNLSLYMMAGFDGQEELLAKLGKHKHGASCLYVNKLADVHMPTLKRMMKKSIAAVKTKYPG